MEGVAVGEHGKQPDELGGLLFPGEAPAGALHEQFPHTSCSNYPGRCHFSFFERHLFLGEKDGIHTPLPGEPRKQCL